MQPRLGFDPLTLLSLAPSVLKFVGGLFGSSGPSAAEIAAAKAAAEAERQKTLYMGLAAAAGLGLVAVVLLRR